MKDSRIMASCSSTPGFFRFRCARSLRNASVLLAGLLACAVGSALPTFAVDAPGDGPEPDAAVLATLRSEATDGTSESKIALANVLAYGEGASPERRREAALWYRQAAKQGNAEGQFTLALWLWHGLNVERDRSEAVQWWRKAADQGRSDAQFWLAGAYQSGAGGLSIDLVEAAKWYRRSAEQGYGESQSSFGTMCAKGEGVPRDDREAVRWFRKAARQNSASGRHYLAEMYAAGRGVRKNEKEAARLYLLAAEADFTVSMDALGEAYEQGRGVRKNRLCAYFWYGFAAKRGFSVGERNRDALAPKLSESERKHGERMVAAADFEGDVVVRPACPGEKLKKKKKKK